MLRYCLAIMALLFTAPAFALDLAEARSQGLVCEQVDGFVVAKQASAPGVAQLVASVNEARRAEYARISKANGQPVSVVGTLAAQKLVENGASKCP